MNWKVERQESGVLWRDTESLTGLTEGKKIPSSMYEFLLVGGCEKRIRQWTRDWRVKS